jgi:FtsP/CotA-like multicopper oxidase with cupredoxin domain
MLTMSMLLERKPNTLTEDHSMTIVAIDGAATVPTSAESITISCGQRYDVIIQGKGNPTRNYAIRSYQADSNLQANGQLRYNADWDQPPTMNSTSATSIDDFIIKPQDGKQLLQPVDRTVTLPVTYFGKANRR